MAIVSFIPARVRRHPDRLGLLAMLACLAACTVPDTASNREFAAAHEAIPKPTCPHIPAPQSTKPLKPPASAFPQFLQPGHWEWDTSGYVWTPPRWHSRFTPKPPKWVDGYWEANGGACVWHNGKFVAAPKPRPRPLPLGPVKAPAPAPVTGPAPSPAPGVTPTPPSAGAVPPQPDGKLTNSSSTH